MANYFAGPSTPQMRLTMFLIGGAALAAGIYTAAHRIEASAANQYGVVHTYCGTAFAPVPSRNFFPELAEACDSALSGYPQAAIAMYAVAGLFLIRFAYMLIGPKANTT